MSAQVLYCFTVPPSQSSNKDTENYLNKLFERCEHGFIEIRQISKKRIPTQEWIPLDAESIPKYPEDENIYVGVATRKEGKGDKDGIVEIPAVWSDIDFKDIDQDEVDRRIAAFTLQPSIIVNSGKGYHLYWILNTPAKREDIARIESINKRLVNNFGGDKGSVDAAHTLRVPGTYNIKYDPPRLVTLNQTNQDAVYDLNDFDFLPPTEPEKAVSSENPKDWYVGLLQGVHEGKRNQAAVRLTGRYIEKGLSENEAQILLSKWNLQNIPPLPSDELESIVKYDYKHYQRPNISLVDSSSQDYTSVIESSVMRFSTFMHKTLPIRPYIIKPLLKKGELIMVSAARGVGKTWFALSLGFMATRQLKINNWETSELTETLYIDGEISEDEMQDRIYKLKIARKVEQAPFYLLSSDEMRSNDKKTPNLTNPSWRSSISEYLKSHPDIGLVILDNLASLTPGRDENKKRDWDEINGWLLELRSKGIAVIFLHHEGKGGDQRGTSAIEDNINFSIRLKHPEGYHKEDGAKFVVEFTKSRRLYGEDTKSFILKLEKEGPVLDWKVISDEEQNTEAQIMNMLKEGLKQKDIAKMLGVSASWVSQVVKKAKEMEKAKRMGLVCAAA